MQFTAIVHDILQRRMASAHYKLSLLLFKQNSSDPEQLELYCVVAVHLWCKIVCSDWGA